MAGGQLKDVVPVSGKVTVDGQPVSDVLLELWSSNSNVKPVKSVTAGADGKYCWTTYINCDGIEPGPYKVTFKQLKPVTTEKKTFKNQNKQKSEDLFGGRYSDVSKSKFELTVEAGKPQKNVDYQLDSK
jgi:hypothetical protein